MGTYKLLFRALMARLSFSPALRVCIARIPGRRYRVKGRLDRLISDGTGEMRKLKNTVLLEGVTCRCSYLGFGVGGCSRCEFVREIWLRRSDHIAID